MKHLSVLKDQTEAIVRQAALLTQGAFTTTEKNTVVNIVTSADIAIQEFLQARLCALLPGSDFFGEEEPTGKTFGEYMWVVDPIDGTANFSRGIGEYAISVALLRNDTPVLGIVYKPQGDILYSAVKNGGAQRNGVPIHVSDATFAEGIFCTAMSLYRKEYANDCMKVIADAYAQCNDVRRFGSCALELCYLAEGICDLYFEFRVFPWDHAAAALILQEAGGIIRGQNAQPLPFDRTTPVIAANSEENFNKLNSIVQKHIPKFPYKEILR